MLHDTGNSDFNPTLHIIPLESNDRTPVMFFSSTDETGTLAAVTDNGRISFFPLEANTIFADQQQIAKDIPLATAISERIEQRFPNDKDIFGNDVNQYLAVGVMYSSSEQGWAKFIFEVWGFQEPFHELDNIYESLISLGGTNVGDSNYIKIEEYLSSEPVRGWINELIKFLKEQLNWKEYIQHSLDYRMQEQESYKYAISFGGGNFKVRAKPDVSLWCIDNDCQPCAVVLPKASYQLLDSFVTEYAEKHHVAATIGCKGLDTEAPVFMPVVMSIDTYNSYYAPLSEFMMNKLTPPKELAKTFLENVDFIEKDDNILFIKLCRQAKNLGKGDLSTRDKEGNQVEIYVNYFTKTEKPYSIKELYGFKLKNLFKF